MRMTKEGLVDCGQVQGVENFKGFKLRLVRIAGSLHTSFETDTIDTVVGSKSESVLFTTFPPMWFVAGIRTDNDCFVPIPRREVTILIFDRIAMHSRVVVAWTAWVRPSGKAKNTNRRSAAAPVVVNVETNTGVGIFARNLSTTVWRGDHKRGEVIGVLRALLEPLIVISACELQRARLKDLDTFASVDFEIPALLPVLTVHARIIRVTTGAGEPHDSWKHQCNTQSVQELHGFYCVRSLFVVAPSVILSSYSLLSLKSKSGIFWGIELGGCTITENYTNSEYTVAKLKVEIPTPAMIILSMHSKTIYAAAR
jgi:hypothetical protein